MKSIFTFLILLTASLSISAQTSAVTMTDLRNVPGFPQPDSVVVCGVADTVAIAYAALEDVTGPTFGVALPAGVFWDGYMEVVDNSGTNISFLFNNLDPSSPEILLPDMTGDDAFFIYFTVRASCDLIDALRNERSINFEYSAAYTDGGGTAGFTTYSPFQNYNSAFLYAALNIVNVNPNNFVNPTGSIQRDITVSQDGINAWLNDFNFTNDYDENVYTLTGVEVNGIPAVYVDNGDFYTLLVDGTFFPTATNTNGDILFDEDEEVIITEYFDVTPHCFDGQYFNTYSTTYTCEADGSTCDLTNRKVGDTHPGNLYDVQVDYNEISEPAICMDGTKEIVITNNTIPHTAGVDAFITDIYFKIFNPCYCPTGDCGRMTDDTTFVSYSYSIGGVNLPFTTNVLNGSRESFLVDLSDANSSILPAGVLQDLDGDGFADDLDVGQSITLTLTSTIDHTVINNCDEDAERFTTAAEEIGCDSAFSIITGWSACGEYQTSPGTFTAPKIRSRLNGFFPSVFEVLPNSSYEVRFTPHVEYINMQPCPGRTFDILVDLPDNVETVVTDVQYNGVSLVAGTDYTVSGTNDVAINIANSDFTVQQFVIFVDRQCVGLAHDLVIDQVQIHCDNGAGCTADWGMNCTGDRGIEYISCSDCAANDILYEELRFDRTTGGYTDYTETTYVPPTDFNLNGPGDMRECGEGIFTATGSITGGTVYDGIFVELPQFTNNWEHPPGSGNIHTITAFEIQVDAVVNIWDPSNTLVVANCPVTYDPLATYSFGNPNAIMLDISSCLPAGGITQDYRFEVQQLVQINMWFWYELGSGIWSPALAQNLHGRDQATGDINSCPIINTNITKMQWDSDFVPTNLYELEDNCTMALDYSFDNLTPHDLGGLEFYPIGRPDTFYFKMQITDPISGTAFDAQSLGFDVSVEITFDASLGGATHTLNSTDYGTITTYTGAYGTTLTNVDDAFTIPAPGMPEWSGIDQHIADIRYRIHLPDLCDLSELFSQYPDLQFDNSTYIEVTANPEGRRYAEGGEINCSRGYGWSKYTHEGDASPGMTLATLISSINKPTIDIALQQPVITPSGTNVNIPIQVCNLGADDADFSWIGFESQFGSYSFLDVLDMDAGGTSLGFTDLSALNPASSIGMLEMGAFTAGACRNFEVVVQINNCLVDSLVFWSGNHCYHYPSDPRKGVSASEFATNVECYDDEEVQLFQLPRTEMQTNIIAQPPVGTPLCGEAEYIFEIKNVREGGVNDLDMFIYLSLNAGVTLVSGSFEMSHPAGAPYVPIPDFTPTGVLTTQGDQYGLMDFMFLDGILATADSNRLYIRFRILTDCDYESGNYVGFQATGTDMCSQPVTTKRIISDPFYVDPTQDHPFNNYLTTVDQLEPNSCSNQGDFVVNVIPLDGLPVTSVEQLCITFPPELPYVPGSLLPVAPASWDVSSATTELVGAAPGLTRVCVDMPVGQTGAMQLGFTSDYVGCDAMLIVETLGQMQVDCNGTGQCLLDVITNYGREASFSIDSYFNILDAEAYFSPAADCSGDQLELSISFENSSTIPIDADSEVNIWLDANGNNIIEPGLDVLIGNTVHNPTIAPVEVVTIDTSYPLDHTLTCNLMLELVNDQCACQVEQQPLNVAGFAFPEIVPPLTELQLCLTPEDLSQNVTIDLFDACLMFGYDHEITVIQTAGAPTFAQVISNGTDYTFEFTPTNDVTSFDIINTIETPCGSSSDTIKVLVVSQLSDLGFALTDDPDCSSANHCYLLEPQGLTDLSLITDFSWSPTTDMDDPTVLNPRVCPTADVTYTLTYTVGDCTLTADVPVVSAPNTFNFTLDLGADQAICYGQLTPTANSVPVIAGATYSWSPIDGVSNPTIANPDFYPSSTTTYSLTVTLDNGCAASDEFDVAVTTLPSATLDAAPGTVACDGSPITLTANGGGPFTTYHWYHNGAPVSSGASNTYNATLSGTYYVIGEDGASCIAASDTLDLFIGSPEVFVFGSDVVTYCHTDTPTPLLEGSLNPLTGLPYASYQWQLDGVNVLIADGGQDRILPYLGAGTYQLFVTDAGGCSGASQTIEVTFTPGCPPLCPEVQCIGVQGPFSITKQ